MKLKIISIDEEGEKKNKSLALKVEEPDLDGDMDLIVKNFKRFLKKEKSQKEEQGKDEEKSPFIPTCYNCEKKGNIKPYCPLFKKTNKKSRKTQKKKKIYVAWEDNDMESSDDEEEKYNICLIENY